MRINDKNKDYIIAQDLFGELFFKADNKPLCQAVKKLRRCNLLIADEFEDGLVIVEVENYHSDLDARYCINKKYLE